MPIPHKGARRWPLTDVRLQRSPHDISAAATVVPGLKRKD
jgi:hypothetical protein